MRPIGALEHDLHTVFANSRVPSEHSVYAEDAVSNRLITFLGKGRVQ